MESDETTEADFVCTEFSEWEVEALKDTKAQDIWKMGVLKIQKFYFIKTSTANQSNIAYSILSLNTDKLQALFLRRGLSILTIHIPSRQASPVFMNTFEVNSFFLSNHPII